MQKRYVPALIVLILLVAAACGGGSGGGIVSIQRLDFDPEDHIVNVFGHSVPPVPHEYPAVVATVNGEALTGDALMARQVQLVWTRDSLLGSVSRSDEEFAPLIEQFDTADPLKLVIDEALLRQAVLREGTLASRTDVEQSLRENEADLYSEDRGWKPGELAEFQETVIAYGYPLHDWAADDGIVEDLRMRRGIGNLGKLACDGIPESPFDHDLTSITGYDCDAFLAAERAAADIEIYVRWVD